MLGPESFSENEEYFYSLALLNFTLMNMTSCTVYDASLHELINLENSEITLRDTLIIDSSFYIAIGEENLKHSESIRLTNGENDKIYFFNVSIIHVNLTKEFIYLGNNNLIFFSFSRFERIEFNDLNNLVSLNFDNG